MKNMIFALLTLFLSFSAQANYAIGRVLPGQSASCEDIYYTGHYPFITGHPRVKMPSEVEVLIDFNLRHSNFYHYTLHTIKMGVVETEYQDVNGEKLLHQAPCQLLEAEEQNCIVLKGCAYRAHAL